MPNDRGRSSAAWPEWTAPARLARTTNATPHPSLPEAPLTLSLTQVSECPYSSPSPGSADPRRGPAIRLGRARARERGSRSPGEPGRVTPAHDNRVAAPRGMADAQGAGAGTSAVGSTGDPAIQRHWHAARRHRPELGGQRAFHRLLRVPQAAGQAEAFSPPSRLRSPGP
jgi:hypothetical protein